jgi:hypothetical protein
MSKSEIFDSFVKIAQKEGLLSESDHAEHTEKDFSETNPRMDSLTIEQIGKLYNTKPRMPKDMEYEHNIMEDAHPDPVVLSPAHDKLNGLVENNNERQRIMMRIVHKEPDGHLTQRKYAQKDLVLSLVRLANELDNNGQDELRALADVCLVQATGKKKVLSKTAVWQFVIPAIAAAVGLLWVQQHTNFKSEGVVNDFKRVMDMIDSLVISEPSWGMGYKFTPQFVSEMTKLKNDLNKLYTSIQKVIPIIQSLEKLRSKTEILEQLSQIAQDPKTQEANQAVEAFKQQFNEVYPEIQQTLANFSRQSYKDESIADRGVLQEGIDWTRVLEGGHGLFADPFDKLKQALTPMWEGIEEMAHTLSVKDALENSLKRQLSQTEAESGKAFKPTEAPPVETAKPAGEPSAFEKAMGPLEEEFKGLSGGLGGL